MAPTNKHPTKRTKAGDNSKEQADPTKGDKSQFDRPPAYSTHPRNTRLSTSSPASSSTVAATNALTRPCLQPTNFVYMNQERRIKRTYVIDPSLQIPHMFLPLIDDEKKRENNVMIQGMSAVDVDLWLVGRKNSEKGLEPVGKRTRTYVGSTAPWWQRDEDCVTVKINAIDNIAPVWLRVSAASGRATVLIPRSFHGPIAVKSTDQKRGVSHEIFKNSTQLTTMAQTRMFFVGDYSAVSRSGFDSAEWAGDQLVVETQRGWVRIKYVDEDEPVVTPKRRFFDRLFGK